MAKFEFIETEVPGIVLVKPTVHGDDRGYFMESYHKEEFEAGGINTVFVQDNVSRSKKGVLRGLHFQKENTQAKLVRVTMGRVFDVGVDLRPNSPFFGKWAGVELSEENKLQLYVPQGFGHGFLVLSDMAEFSYKCSDYYNQSAEGGVHYADLDIAVKWPEPGVPVSLSGKDAALPGLNKQDFSFFERWYKF